MGSNVSMPPLPPGFQIDTSDSALSAPYDPDKALALSREMSGGVKSSGGVNLSIMDFSKPGGAVPPPLPEGFKIDSAPQRQPMVNQTLVEKGGSPTQLNKTQADAYSIFDKLYQGDRDAAEMERKRKFWQESLSTPDPRLVGQGYGGKPAAGIISGGLNAIDIGMKAVPAMVDLATYPIRSSFPFQSIHAPPEERAKLSGLLTQNAPGANELMGLLTGRTPKSVAMDREAIKEEFPWASFAGETGTDVLSLITGKTNFTRLARILEGRSALKIARGEKVAEGGTTAVSKAAAAERRWWNKPYTTKVKRWAGRGAEAGVEGTVFGAIKSDDPIQVGAVTGGMQLGLGFVEGVAKHKVVPKSLRGGLFGFALQVGTMGAALQTMASLIPGEQKAEKDYNARQAAIDKGIATFVLGATATFLGGRSRTGAHATLRPQFTEAITSIPRHTITSFVSRALERSPEEQKIIIEKAKALTSGEGAFSASKEYVQQWHKALSTNADAAIDFLLENER